MSQVIVMYRNILEEAYQDSTSNITVSPVENASFPSYRLHDRDIGKYFKFSTTGSPVYVLVNQSGTVYEIDSLVIPYGHNLNGLDCSLRYSTDNFVSDDHEAVGWTQGDELLIYKTFTAQTKQYWKLNITAPGTTVELQEMYLTKGYSFLRNPSYNGSVAIRRNIVRDMTQAGITRVVKLGESKRARRYDVLVETTQKVEFENWENECQGVKSFYIVDHEGTTIFMENQIELEFRFAAPLYWNTSLDLLEVL
jgi:hypothetical protein